ncbi:putative Zinc finger CCCH domain-containing protein 44 [Cocos nucifera]|nr:putative Zinc finger CCCH domain-containing protein 44 [Cocos nucifera]
MLFEYIDRRELLCTPAERSRLLKEIPQVIADTEEVEVTTDTLLKSCGEHKGGNIAIMEVLPEEAKGNVSFSCENAAEERSEGNGADSHHNALEGQPEGNVAAFHEDAAEEKSEGAPVADVEVPTEEAKGLDNEAASHENSVDGRPEGNEASSNKAANNEEVEGMGASVKVSRQLGTESEPLKPSVINENSNTSQIIEIVEDKEIPRHKMTADVQIIDLDEDEGDCLAALKENDPSTTDTCYKIVEAVISDPERQKVWHYIDPLGNEQGPFELASLRYWREEGFFDDDFRVWRAGQSKEDAILLIDALR